jgi:hypothetical protein
MVGEIGEQQRADDGPEGAAGASSNFVEYCHTRNESQAESHRQLRIVLNIQFFAQNEASVAKVTQSSRFGLIGRTGSCRSPQTRTV